MSICSTVVECGQVWGIKSWVGLHPSRLQNTYMTCPTYRDALGVHGFLGASLQVGKPVQAPCYHAIGLADVCFMRRPGSALVLSWRHGELGNPWLLCHPVLGSVLTCAFVWSFSQCRPWQGGTGKSRSWGIPSTLCLHARICTDPCLWIGSGCGAGSSLEAEGLGNSLASVPTCTSPAGTCADLCFR